MNNRIATTAAALAVVTLLGAAGPVAAKANSGIPLGAPYKQGFDDILVPPETPRACKPNAGAHLPGGGTTIYKDGTSVGRGIVCSDPRTPPSGFGRRPNN